MNILLFSYGNIEYDGRLRELIRVFENVGNFYYFVGAAVKHEQFNEKSRFYTGNNYIQFIAEALKYAKCLKSKSIDAVVIDDRRAIIPGVLAGRILGAKVIQDCRELYFFKEMHHFKGKIGCLIEKTAIKKADILICASRERAGFMKTYYNLSEIPISYENIRKLEYTDKSGPEKYRKKYNELFQKKEIRIITIGDCGPDRTNDVLIGNMRLLPESVRLIIVDKSNSGSCGTVRTNDESDSKITILGRIDQSELKYVIQNCHIGVVNYHQNDLNNKYCASGKLYEFLFEGIPVITTTNPPLKNICNEYSVGVADDEYYNGIIRIIENYSMYKGKVEEYISNISVESNNEKLAEEIKKRFELL